MQHGFYLFTCEISSVNSIPCLKMGPEGLEAPPRGLHGASRLSQNGHVYAADSENHNFTKFQNYVNLLKQTLSFEIVKSTENNQFPS